MFCNAPYCVAEKTTSHVHRRFISSNMTCDLLPAQWTRLKQENENWQDSKCATKQMLSPFPLHHQTRFKLKTDLYRTPSKFSTCSAPPSVHFPLFASLTIPSETAISKQMESLGQMGGKQITEKRVRGNGVQLNTQSSAQTAVEAIKFITKYEATSRKTSHLKILFYLYVINDFLVSGASFWNSDNDLATAHACS